MKVRASYLEDEGDQGARRSKGQTKKITRRSTRSSEADDRKTEVAATQQKEVI